MKRLAWLVLALAFGLLAWWGLSPGPPAPPPGPVAVPTPPEPAATTTTAPPAPAYYPPLDRLNDPASNVTNDLKILRELFFNYQMLVKDSSGNPRGTHEEILRALQGRNRAHLVFVPTNHPAVKNGRLVDRWGSPYFFHALSGTSMEIRSAGPDRKIYTEDDVLLSPTPQSPRPSSRLH